MEGVNDSYPFIRKDVIVTTGEVMFSLVNKKTGNVLADWFEKPRGEGCMEENGIKGKFDPYSIYISRLDPYTTTDELIQHFGSFGDVIRASLLRSKSTGLPGSAYMQFHEKIAAQRALFLDGSYLRGSPIRVQMKLLYGVEANITKADLEDSFDKKSDVDVGVDPLSIYVGNFGQNVTSQELAAHFNVVGEITKVSVFKNKNKNRNSGGAFIQFKDEDAAKNALCMNDTYLDGQLIKVERKRVRVAQKRIKEQSLDGNVSDASVVYDPYSVYVGNVDMKTKEEELERHFDIAGEVLGVTLMKDKCAAVIQFKDLWSVEGALCMAGSRLRGKELKIWRKKEVDTLNNCM